MLNLHGFAWMIPNPSQSPAEGVLHVDSKATIQQQEENPQITGSLKGLGISFQVVFPRSLRSFSGG